MFIYLFDILSEELFPPTRISVDQAVRPGNFSDLCQNGKAQADAYPDSTKRLPFREGLVRWARSRQGNRRSPHDGAGVDPTQLSARRSLLQEGLVQGARSRQGNRRSVVTMGFRHARQQIDRSLVKANERASHASSSCSSTRQA
jgi:hypothetical protein